MKNCRNGVGAHLTRKHTGGVIILIGMATRFTHRHTHAYDARPATQRVVSSRAAAATAGMPAAGRKRMMSIEVLRLLAIVCIAVFHAFLQQYVQAIWMGPHHPVSVAEPVSALASSRGAMWIVAMIMYCGAWGNHIFFMISGFFLIPRMCGAAGSSGYWNTQLRATGRRIAMILATVAFYLLLVLVAGHWAPSVSNDTQSASLVYELEFVWLYLAFVALAPAIAWVLNRLGACRSAVVAGVVLIAVYALNAYVACTWHGQRTLLDWRKQMSAVSYALSFGLAGLLGWAVQHNSERRTEDKRHGVRHADRRPLWTIRGFWLCGVLVLLAVASVLTAVMVMRSSYVALYALSFKSTSLISFALAMPLVAPRPWLRRSLRAFSGFMWCRPLPASYGRPSMRGSSTRFWCVPPRCSRGLPYSASLRRGLRSAPCFRWHMLWWSACSIVVCAARCCAWSICRNDVMLPGG